MKKNNELEFESDKVKTYVQQLQAENALLRQANDEKNELLIKLGCPTTATARRKVHILENQIKVLNADKDDLKAKIELIEISNKTTIDNLKRELIDQEAETLKAGGIINCLEKTLAEIKDIAENITKLPISRPYDACILNKQIIQKIEELKVQ